ncbi:unnamed protein product, partial [Rotaria magnacalcarata]
MAEQIRRSGLQISQGRLFISTLISILWLMLVRSFRYGVLNHDRDGVLGKLVQVVSMIEITSGFGFNPVLPPPYVHYSSIPQNP